MKILNKSVLFLLVLVTTNISFAQVNVTLNVDSNPTPQISEWVNRENLAILTVTNTEPSLVDTEYIIKVKVYLDNELVLKTNNNVTPQFFELGTQTFLADEIIPYNAIDFNSDRIEKSVFKTGMLPAGFYSFCVSIVNPTGVILSKPEEICRNMIITDYQMPELMTPIDDTTIISAILPSTFFRWTPITPIPNAQDGVKYIIAVTEVRNGQTPSQAFQVNYPIIEEEVLAGNQFLWPTNMDIPDEATQYVWSVKPVTLDDNPYKSENNGFVKVETFKTKPTMITKSHEVEIMNCGINPMDLSNLLFFTDTGNDDIVHLHGLTVIQNRFWIGVTGYIDPTKYQLNTYIDWDCTHSIDPILFNATASKRHDYNNSNDNSNSTPSTIAVHMELRSLETGQTCEITVSKKLKYFSQGETKGSKACKFPSQSDFEGMVNFTDTSLNGNDSFKIELADIDKFTRYLEAIVTNGNPDNGISGNVTTELVVNYGCGHNNEREGDGSNILLDHTYDIYCTDDSHFPREICLTYITKIEIRGELINCEKTYCIQLPMKTILALEELIKPNNDSKSQENECFCDDKHVTNPLFKIYRQNPEDFPNTINVFGLGTLDTYLRQCNNDLGGNGSGDTVVIMTSTILWGDGNSTTVPMFTNNMSHNYDYPNQDIPDEITISIIKQTSNPKTGFTVTCTKEYTIPIPPEVKNEITNPGFYCGCSDDAVDTSVLSLSIPDDSPDNTVQISGLDTLYSDVIACAVPIDDLKTTTVTMNINWDPLHMTETMDADGTSTHTFESIPNSAIDHEILDTVCVEFNFTYPDGSTCRKIYCIDVPSDLLTVTNNESCTCTNSTPEPQLNIFVPEPTNYPRKLSLGGVTAYRDWVRECNDEYNEIDPEYNTYKYTFETTINWDSNHSAEAITNNGPFEHNYAITDNIPSQICINIAVAPKPGYTGESCVREFCIDVLQNLQDTNVDTDSTGTIAVGESLFAGQDGEFEIITTQVSESSGKYTGKGTAYIGWLKARVGVKFDSITVDTDKKLLTGIVLAEIYDAPAPVYPQDWALEVVSNNPMANNVAGNIVTWVENTSNQTIDYNGLTDYTTPVKLPLGVNMPNGDQLAITEMVFRHSKSEFNMVAAKTTPPSWGPEQLIGFEAKNLIFHPTQIVTPPERIELIEDVTVGNTNNNVFFTFISPNNSANGCYIEWDENGFSEYGIELNASFTRDWFIPLPDDNTSKTAANFIATGSAWNDLVLTGNFPHSEIVDSGGVTVMANTISYDMSDLLNPPNIVFPQNYPAGAETTNLFRGFYMKQLDIELPEGWQTSAGGQPQLSIQNMIINNSGVTLYAEATNVAQFPSVNVADMAASIDTVKVSISASSLVYAGIKGKIALPISKVDSIQNPLKYNALFSVAQNPTQITNFQLTIDPDGPVNAHLLKGKMEFEPTSSITAYIDKNKKKFNTTLNGNFVWDDVTLGPVKHVNFDLGFQGVAFNYDSSLSSNKMQFNAGSWSFASPQKFLANFPVTIDNIDFTQLSTTGSQFLHGKLNFDVIFNLSKDIGGQTKLAIELGVDENQGGTGAGKFKPKYIGTGIDDITIYAHLPAVSIDGTIQFRNNDPVFGDGFKGTLNASFKAPKVGITALAEFGNTDYQYSSTYRYWRVEAAAKFTPGLPFLPGVAFYGFGGGAYNNMESTLVPASGSIPAAYTFSPKKGNLGFKVEATIGATPKVESFNADVGLNGQFSSSDGMINIGFTGAFYVGAPLLPQSKRDEAQIKGTVLADYNFPNKHFYLGVDVSVDKDPVEALNQSIVLDLNGKTNKWFFKFGEPTNTNDAKIFGINLYQYLMFGNDIQAPANGFTNDFRTRYHNVLNNYPGIPNSTGVDNNSATGRGFALGVGVKFDKSVGVNLPSNYQLGIALDAGAEVNLSMMEYNGQNCADPSQQTGFNGWRARGNIGFYADASVGLTKNGNAKNWNLLELKAGGWLDAKFPRPTYVAGAVEGYIKAIRTKVHVLGDCSVGDQQGYHAKHWRKWTPCVHYTYIVNKHFDKSFDWGDDCANGDNNTSTNTGPSATQQDAASDQEQNLIKYVHAGPTFNFPTTKPVAVKYGLPINEAFDVTEQQSSGAVKTRTFKLKRTVKMYKKAVNSSNYTTMMYNVDQNNLGEYLYTKGGLATLTLAAVNTNMFATAMQTNQQASNNVSTMSFVSMQMQSFQPTSAMFTTFPAPTPPPPPQTSEYDNLPPEADPVVNSLEVNRTYKIVVTATLKEYINNVWVDAEKSDNSTVTQTITKTFRTGPMESVSANASSQQMMLGH